MTARKYITAAAALMMTAALVPLAAAPPARPSVAPKPIPIAEASGEKVSLGPLASRGRASGPVALNIAGPIVRIGLSTDERHVTLSSPGGFHLVDAKTGRDLWRRTHRGDLHVVLEPKGVVGSTRFRVQVASLRDAEDAESLRARVETETGEVATITPDPDRHAYRVRVGQAPSREAVQPIEEKVRGMGFAETWIVEESTAAGRKIRVRLVDDDYNDLLVDPKTILALPATAGKPMEVEGKPYRGAVEVLVTGSVRLRAVNVVGLEDYLRGVVPHELGPGLYPELEALKAQAVAARTYVVANRGQFAGDGYDICDTPRCQVYEGSKGEDALSDRAIAETAGLVATYGGQPINALYTATCGGHTEDSVNVFSQEKAPYLMGVDCYANEASLAALRRKLTGAAPLAPVAGPDGSSLDEGLALLDVLGVFDPATAAPARMAETATSLEVSTATSRALQVCGKPSSAPPLPQGAYPSTADLSRYLVSAFDWQDRVDVLLDPRDAVTLLGGDLLTGRATSGIREAAYLVKEGIFPARLAAGDDLLAPATRALLYRALHRMVLKYDAAGLEKGIFRGARGESLVVIPEADEAKSLGAAREIAPSPDAWLSREGVDGTALVAELALVPGDRLSWHQGKDGHADFIRQKANVKGASDDRFTAVYQWEVRSTRKELQEKIRERASIGELIDVVPMKRGVSGRVVELLVVGSAGRFTFRGFPIRTLLGLRENLFVVDRQRDADGRVTTFVFTGKGWGHGVGLCQVGAFGMALRGARFDDILKRYYTGIEIEPLAR